jgi:antitoxin HicB
VARKAAKGHIGSSFDDFLKEEGIYEECTAAALKRVLARQITRAMEDEGLSKSAMARRMETSTAALNRLLDPENDSITLHTITKAARALGRHVEIRLV